MFFYCDDRKVREQLINLFIKALSVVIPIEGELLLQPDEIIQVEEKKESTSESSTDKKKDKDNIDDPSSFIAPVIISSNSLVKLFINR